MELEEFDYNKTLVEIDKILEKLNLDTAFEYMLRQNAIYVLKDIDNLKIFNDMEVYHKGLASAIVYEVFNSGIKNKYRPDLSQVKLAKIAGLNRRTIYKYLKLIKGRQSLNTFFRKLKNKFFELLSR